MPTAMQIHLAPMEGVVNARMRAMLTAIGGIDRCVTEFVRVSDQLLPPRVFHRLCPELQRGGVTASGVPVYLQLLGSDPQLMAENAQRAAELGAPGIDSNFGCPAKCVNRHRGGSVLLDEPQLLHDIVAAMRRAVPADIPVTAKMRLGFRDASRLQDIVQALVSAGANEITIHARTRDDGYRPPAHWWQLAELSGFNTRLIANGEVWSPEDHQRCQQLSGCQDVMIGRGLLARPDLAREIKARHQGQLYQAMSWSAVTELLALMLQDSIVNCHPRHVGGPIKQWLGYLRRHYPQAEILFSDIKRLTEAATLQAALARHSQGKKLAA